MGEKQHFPCREHAFHSRLWVLVMVEIFLDEIKCRAESGSIRKNQRIVLLPDIDRGKIRGAGIQDRILLSVCHILLLKGKFAAAIKLFSSKRRM